MRPKFDTGDKVLITGENGNDYELTQFRKEKKETALAWWVFADREGVEVYKDPRQGSEVVNRLGLGEHLVVLDEKDVFLRVAKVKGANASDNPELGWVRKSELLLWNYPMTERNTGIDIKAFIVNTQDFIAENKKSGSIAKVKDIYKIYDSPYATEPRQTGNLYEVLFVFKYDENTQRYLISNNYGLNDDDQLLGWVNANRVQLWETALALEPNFTEKAVAERQNRDDFHSRVFLNPNEANRFLRGDNVQHLVMRDVVRDDLEGLVIPELTGSGETYLRYEGSLARFPLFNVLEETYECGVLGKLTVGNTKLLPGQTDVRLAHAEKKFAQREKGLRNMNVVFVIEAGREMRPYIERINDIIDDVNEELDPEERADLDFGAVVYSDIYCDNQRPEEVIHSLIKVTDQKKFKAQLETVNYIPTGPVDGYQASYFALDYAVRNAGMNPGENNIVVHLGSQPDLSLNFARSCLELEKSGSLYDIFTEYSVHYMAVQCYQDGSSSEEEFIVDATALIDNVSSQMFNEVRDKTFYEDLTLPDDPKIIESNDKGKKSIDETAVSVMQVIWPDTPGDCSGVRCLDQRRYVREVSEMILASRDKAKDEIKLIKRLYLDDSNLKDMASSYSGNVMVIMERMGVSQEELKEYARERVQLYWDGAAPIKVKEAQNDMWTLVLFLSEYDVSQIKREMDRIKAAKRLNDHEGKKKIVQAFWSTLAQNVLNWDQDLELNELTINDIRKQMVGLESEGVDLGGGVLDKLTVEDLNEIRPEKLNEYLNEIEIKAQFWEEISTSGYQFSYYPAGKDDKREKFYWIPFNFIY